jgi:transcriptional regulator with XRE-family HTH domain
MSKYTDDQVRNIFNLRANGKTQQQIGDVMGCSDSHISTILNRKLYPNVAIPPSLLEKIGTMKGRARKPRKILQPAPPLTAIPVHGLLANYTAVCHDLKQIKDACLEAGINSDTLELLRESVRNGV